MSSLVLFEERVNSEGYKVGVVTLQAEKTLNSLTLCMVENMLDRLLSWREDEALVAVFIEGAGERAFCAGGDVQALHLSAVARPGGPCEYAEQFFQKEYRLDYLLHTYDKPVIVWGHGIVMGGGLGIFAAGSHRIVTETTRIAMPEVTIALYPDVGASYFLNRMPGQCGRFLALTAASINATDSLYVGLADCFISHTHKDTCLNELLALPWRGEHEDHKLVSTLLTRWQAEGESEQPKANLEPQQALIDRLCDGDTKAVLAAFNELCSDNPWLSRAKEGLLCGSPLATLWIDRQLRLSQTMTLEEVFCSELLLSTNLVRYPEFAEGVRALLIDKDGMPKWRYTNIDQVPDDLLASFFTTPWSNNPLADLGH